MIDLYQDTTTIDYDNGNFYYSYEYYNLDNFKYNLIKNYIDKKNFYNYQKFFYKTKYFHFSIQKNKLIFYYRLFDIGSNYILVGIDLNHIGKILSFKIYLINRNSGLIKAFKIYKNNISKISSKFILKTKNINIIYRDSKNIYISFDGSSQKLIRKENKIKRIINKIIKKYEHHR